MWKTKDFTTTSQWLCSLTGVTFLVPVPDKVWTSGTGTVPWFTIWTWCTYYSPYIQHKWILHSVVKLCRLDSNFWTASWLGQFVSQPGANTGMFQYFLAYVNGLHCTRTIQSIVILVYLKWLICRITHGLHNLILIKIDRNSPLGFAFSPSTEIYKIVSQKKIVAGESGDDSPTSDTNPITIPPTTSYNERKRPSCCQSWAPIQRGSKEVEDEEGAYGRQLS